jgi:hypothetical protein
MKDLIYVGVFIACLLATWGLAKLCNVLARDGSAPGTASKKEGTP